MKQVYKKLSVVITLSFIMVFFGEKQVMAESCPSTISAPVAPPDGWETQAQVKLPLSFAIVDSSGSIECFYTMGNGLVQISKQCSKVSTGNGTWSKYQGSAHKCGGRGCTFVCH